MLGETTKTDAEPPGCSAFIEANLQEEERPDAMS